MYIPSLESHIKSQARNLGTDIDQQMVTAPGARRGARPAGPRTAPAAARRGKNRRDASQKASEFVRGARTSLARAPAAAARRGGP
eukprot:COSAG02_NODE_2243_length_9392_cov_12.624449_1_plen_84_part_10